MKYKLNLPFMFLSYPHFKYALCYMRWIAIFTLLLSYAIRSNEQITIIFIFYLLPLTQITSPDLLIRKVSHVRV